MTGRVHFFLLLLLACACKPTPRAELGKTQYEKYCASCHPVAEAGGAPSHPEALGPDLTRLRERYGSPLPRDELAAFIDGRREVEAHGQRDMPVWGARLYEDYPQTPGTEAVRGGTVEIILDHLETIQVE